MVAVAMTQFRGATAVKEIGPKPMLLLVLKKGKRVMHIPLTDLVWFY